MEYQQEYRQKEFRQAPAKKDGGSFGGKLLGSLIKKVVLSPLVVFLVGYFYFNQNLQKGVLGALVFYTGLTFLLILMKIVGILTSAATFRLFSVIKKSLDLVIMVVMLIVYWFIYSIWSQGNFDLF